MANEQHRYTPEQVQIILEHALNKRKKQPDGISHKDLLETARELDIDDQDLEEALREYEETWAMQDARERWMQRRKQKFFEHLRTYAIVNSAFMVLALVTSGGTWFLWSIFGWGIGLALDAKEAFRPKEKDIDKGARRLLHKEQKERSKLERQQYWHNMSENIKKQFTVDSRRGKIIIEKGDRRIEIG